MVNYKCKLATMKVLFEFLHPKHQSQCLLLNLSIVELTGYECPEWKMIGCSDQAGKMFHITAPRPYAEATVANFNGNIGSYWVSTFVESVRSLETLKGFVHSEVHFCLHPSCISVFRCCIR